MREIGSYAKYLKEDGQLILSGFYSNDLVDIKRTAFDSGLQLSRSKEINDWTGAVFIKM
jgi:ribosomal protein L11 methylase PrmA